MDSSEVFGCNQCSKCFYTLSRYNQHLKTHTKPFQCSECVRSFALRSDLTRHVQARHRIGVARHACVVTGCSFKASRKDNIRQHVKNSHAQLLLDPGKPRSGRRRRAKLASVDVPLDVKDERAIVCTLMQAASMGNVGLLRAILQTGIDISAQADDGSTALHCAAKTDQIEIVNLLVKMGARTDVVNDKGRTPLHEAILGHCTHTFATLVGRRADLTQRVIVATIETNQSQFFQDAWALCGEEMFRWFGKKLFAIAADSTNTASMATILLLPNITQQWIESAGGLVLRRIIHKNQEAMLEYLLRSGKLDVNTALGTPYHETRSLLYLAAARGRSEIVGLLLEFETIDLDLAVRDEISSPLGIAAWRGHLQVVEKLLQCSGIVVDGKRMRQENATTSLHLACRRGHVGIIGLLLKAFDDRGLDVDIQDTSGLRITPLQNAVRSGHKEAVALLLLRRDVGVNRAFVRSGMTLLQAAAQGGHGKTLSVLLGDGRVDRNDVRNSRQSLLSDALWGGHWCLVEILFDYESVPLNITRQSLNLATEPSGKRVDILERGLLEIASLPTRDNNAWHRAARTGDLSLAMLLLEHAQKHDSCSQPMVDVNRRNWHGQAPLHVAVESGKIDIIELLLHHTQIDVNLTLGRPHWQRGRSAIEIVERGWYKYWRYHKEERAYTVELLLAHGAQTASRNRADNANKVVLPLSDMGVEGNVQHLSEHSEDLRRKNHASWASVVGIHDGAGGPGVTNVEDKNTVGDNIPFDMDDSMVEDPDAIFEEWMCFDDEEPSGNNSSLEMWEREMSLEQPGTFASL
ncbi:ankyrin repeat-containing domain protein [Alternaria rosae]|uniref:ankyrin repeat-containing domain protein n=1 Tax=Alternaria rosae TaxID=1187941 RepID=UPI001E8E90BB|nr:ankyrin repeat-containing domain protein [Alternaria rosae]KAH6867990.1 ankyrin repeat-containing domain protein [Alternaria rosae]